MSIANEIMTRAHNAEHAETLACFSCKEHRKILLSSGDVARVYIFNDGSVIIVDKAQVNAYADGATADGCWKSPTRYRSNR